MKEGTTEQRRLVSSWKKTYPGLQMVDQLGAKLWSIANTVEEFRITDYSTHVFTREFLDHENMPFSKRGGARKGLGVLICVWKQTYENKNLAKISSQPAAIIRDLKRRGYRFSEERSNGTRRCTGIDVGEAVEAYIKINKKERRKLLEDKKCPILGTTKHLEIDHREPVETARRRGKDPSILIPEDLEGDAWMEEFQILSKSANNQKREICEKCRTGGDIVIPAVIERPGRFKKTQTDGDPNSCKGCFWFDWENPLRP